MSERIPPKTLPWHVRAGEHVYIWAGGEHVRRMPFADYQLLCAGVAVGSEYLEAESWQTIEEFEVSCADHEIENQPRGLFAALPGMVIDQQ